jgi:hypothetical protein
MSRSTNKYLKVADLLKLYHGELKSDKVEGLDFLIKEGHSLPTFLLSMDREGFYHLESHLDLIGNLEFLLQSTVEIPKRRKINQYIVSVIIVEPGENPEQLLEVYKGII